MARTITGTYFSGVTLTSVGDNPVTIAGTAKILDTTTDGYGLRGDGSTVWTITNLGTIISKELSTSSAHGAGVQLDNGGTLINGAKGFIAGGDSGGVFVYPDPTALVANLGTIVGLGDAATGVALYGGGVVRNGITSNHTALIKAPHNGVGIAHAVGTVVNDGTIIGAGSKTVESYGVYLGAGGSVINGSSSDVAATIQGGYFGVQVSGGAGTVLNVGTIVGLAGSASSWGVRLSQEGTVTNGASGNIGGDRYGVGIMGGPGLVVNNGTIAATSEFGIEFNAGGAFTNSATGYVVGVQRGVNFSGSATATVTNLGRVSGDTGIALPGGGATVTNAGTIVGTGGGAIVGSLGDERLIVDPGAVFVGTVDAFSGNNTLELAAGAGAGTLTGIGTQFLDFGQITFDPGTDWLLGGNANGLAGGQIITGFTTGGTIDLTGFAAVSDSFSNNALVLTDSLSNTATIGIAGSFSTSSFALAPDGAGGTDIVTVGTTISGTYFSGVTLTSAAENPVTFTGKIIDNTSDGYGLRGAGSTRWTITNTGTIISNVVSTATAHGAGVQLDNGGTLVNGATGVISGGDSGGVFIYPDPNALVANAGTIIGLGDAATGVLLYGGGTVRNGATGDVAALIGAPHNGVGIANAPGSVVNYGTIAGTGAQAFVSYGIYLGAGGRVANVGTSALIIGGPGAPSNDGGPGVRLKGGGVVTNAGTIAGGQGGSGGPVPTFAGRGGVAIYIAAGTIVNSGVVAGGQGGAASDAGGEGALGSCFPGASSTLA